MTALDERTNQARRALDAIESTLSTLTKMARDIEPSYCTEGDLATLTIVGDLLNDAEDKMADLCAENVERAEDEDAGNASFPFLAWDMVGQRVVTVYEWHVGGQRYLLGNNETARPSELTTAFPTWYVRAEAQLLDAQDQAETQAAALGVGVQ